MEIVMYALVHTPTQKVLHAGDTPINLPKHLRFSGLAEVKLTGTLLLPEDTTSKEPKRG